ncbi:MAG: hypothetical protein SGPRY_011771 [Prymnesium sp.]
MPFFASLEYRTATLRRLEADYPLAVGTYALSSWMYSLAGLIYLYLLPFLPPTHQTTPLLSGRMFGTLLVVQGACSFIHDGRITLGKPFPPGRHFWLLFDRCLAWLLMLTVVGNALVWPSCSKATRGVSVALVLTCGVTYPSSKYCEVRGWMRSFLVLHSLWHYVPNLLAIIWISLCAAGNES